MSVVLRCLREAASFLASYIAPAGTLVVDTTNNVVQVHDGVTPGGWPAARADQVFAAPTGTPAVGDIFYGTGGATSARLADVAVGSVLLSGGVRAAPAWGKLPLTSAVAGVLPIGNGGTGAATAAAALAALGAAASGSNSDITALLALAVPAAFTPVLTCAVIGDLNVSYATQVGFYFRIGQIVFVYVNLVCTPTWTTASGAVQITGLPAVAHASIPGALQSLNYFPQAFPGGTGTMVFGIVPVGKSLIQPTGQKSGSTSIAATISQLTSGTAATISMFGAYIAAASS